MSAAPRVRLTPEQYLAIERKAEWKSEFYNGEMFAMTGVSRQHSRVKENLIIKIGEQLWGSSCRSHSSDMPVKVSRTGLYTYPDIVIVCGEEQYEDDVFDTLLNTRRSSSKSCHHRRKDTTAAGSSAITRRSNHSGNMSWCRKRSRRSRAISVRPTAFGPATISKGWIGNWPSQLYRCGFLWPTSMPG